MQIPLLQIDAFADAVFSGNPAAVCPMLEWPADDVLQSIAAENNLSETAFIVPVPEHYRLRWFTPTMEVDLCGHATLASAHVVFTRLRPDADRVRFETRSGMLEVTRDRNMMTMDFPSVLATAADAPVELLAAMGEPKPAEVYAVHKVHGADYFMLVYANRDQVAALRPEHHRLQANVIVTAPGGDDAGEPDFVSRFFAPMSGIDEDPVTGSAHCTSGPYWAARLDKPHLVARQISRRGGTVHCEVRGDRVLLGGRCVDYLEGTISV